MASEDMIEPALKETYLKTLLEQLRERLAKEEWQGSQGSAESLRAVELSTLEFHFLEGSGCCAFECSDIFGGKDDVDLFAVRNHSAKDRLSVREPGNLEDLIRTNRS